MNVFNHHVVVSPFTNVLSGGSPLSENVHQTLNDNNLRSQQSNNAPLDTCVDIGTQTSMSDGGPSWNLSPKLHVSILSLMSGDSPLYKSARHDPGVQLSPTSPENNGGSVVKSDVHAVYPSPASVSRGCPPHDSSSSSNSTVEGLLIHQKHIPTSSHSSPMKHSLQSDDVYLPDMLNVCSHARKLI